MKIDSSDYVNVGVLFQLSNRLLYPVAYFLKKITLAEDNYNIYDKELLAIIQYFEK